MNSKQPAPDREVYGDGTGLTPAMEQKNAWVFLGTYILTFFAAPVTYIGVVQAALCDKLGASAAVSNLPSSTYLLGSLAPIVFSWLVPHRLERSMVVWGYLVTASVMAVVCAALALPFSSTVRIGTVIGQGLVQGFSGSVTGLFVYQCLRRGTTVEGRVRALKLAFTFSPFAAVAGSLWAQFVLNHGISFLSFPYGFAFLYFIAVPCMAGAAFLGSRYELAPLEDGERPPFFSFIRNAIREYAQDRTLVLLWFGYLFWYSSLSAMPNLSLYTKVALGKEPREFSGLIMALSFGFKALAGYVMGAIALRWGIRAPLIVAALLLGGASLWSWVVPGYAYLLAFGLIGAGQLGGAYFPNYVITVSPAALAPRNMSLLGLSTPASSFAPALYGALTDRFGFPASFILGIVTAVIAIIIILKLPAKPKNPDEVPDASAASKS